MIEVGARLYGPALFILLFLAVPAAAQEPMAWEEEPLFHTFSIAAVDPATGESGVAVTTRNVCVGNGVPWVRAGVGAVATQASTRTEYGHELLDLLEEGVDPAEALSARIAEDDRPDRRQVGVIGLDGRSAQHTGDSTSTWNGHLAGTNYVAQGNTLVGPEVLEAVARNFEASEGSPRHLADRLIDALSAGQELGGDSRRGRLQSAAVIVADPRPGMARRTDGMTVQIHACEHPTPVQEIRRVYNTVSQTLGYRTLEQESGGDVLQLKVILHALGIFRPDEEDFDPDEDDALLYTTEAIHAVDDFRARAGLASAGQGAPLGLVDDELVDLLWRELEERGLAEEVREKLLEVVMVRR